MGWYTSMIVGHSFAELRSTIIEARALALGEVERERAAAAVERWLLAALYEESTARMTVGDQRSTFFWDPAAPGDLGLAAIERA